MGSILVTGGAGYVGSHIVRRLRSDGIDVVVVDDLSEGHREAVGDANLLVGDFADPGVVGPILAGREVEWIVHMAAYCQVGESVEQPAKYYENNVTKSLRLLDLAHTHGVRGMVFSSSAAVYGEPEDVPIPESHPTVPTNPYGETKLAFERALSWYSGAHDFRYVALRYFNAAGAHPSGEIGEDHAPETHLIPNLLRSAGEGGPPTPIFGTDYPTSDGTCVRDYVHVVDLAQAHVRAIGAMSRGEVTGESFNLGSGEGFSVREVLAAVERVAGTAPPTTDAPRRAGDPAVLVASSDLARSRLGWKPEYPALDDIIRTAWNWHRMHPHGYGSGERE
jgi:UDP-glucose 4-epimerase